MIYHSFHFQTIFCTVKVVFSNSLDFLRVESDIINSLFGKYFLDKNIQQIFGLKLNLPNKIFTVRTKSGLFEESGNEPVVLDLVDVLLLERPLSAAQPEPEFGVEIVPVVTKILLFLGHFSSSFTLSALTNFPAGFSSRCV